MSKRRGIDSKVGVGSCAHSRREQLLKDMTLCQELRFGFDGAVAARGLNVRVVMVPEQHLHQLV